jgi:hypothetical protein
MFLPDDQHPTGTYSGESNQHAHYHSSGANLDPLAGRAGFPRLASDARSFFKLGYAAAQIFYLICAAGRSGLASEKPQPRSGR